MIRKLLSAFNNRHFHSLLGNIVSAFLNLLSFSVLIRLFPSKSMFGDWVLFTGTYTILDQVRTALLQSGLIRFYAGTDETTSRRVAGSAWTLVLLLTGVLLVVNLVAGLLLYHLFDPTWQLFIKWLGIMIVVSIPFNFASWLLQAQHRFDKIVQIRIWQNGCFLIMIVLLWLLKMVTVPNILAAYMLGMLATSLFTMAKGWTAIRSIVYSTREQVVALYKYGYLIVGSMLTSGFVNYSDNFLIRTMISPAALAFYSIQQKFMEVIEIILRSFVATAQPTLSASANQGDWPGVARSFSRYTGAVTLIITPFILGLILMTKPAIIILAGKDYLPSTEVVRIFLFMAILYPIDRFIGVTLDMINRPLTNFYKNLLKLVLNVIGDIVFIKLFHDIRWVAFGSLINMVVCVIVGYFMLRRYIQYNVRDIFELGWAECKSLVGKFTGKLFVKRTTES